MRKWIDLINETEQRSLSSEQMISYIGLHHGKSLHTDYVEFLQSFKSFDLQDIPLSLIKTDLPKLDATKVKQYASLDMSKAPPIVVYPHDGGFLILDGYHRASALKAQGVAQTAAYVGNPN